MIFHSGLIMVLSNHVGSMYGMYANIWGTLMVNVTIYSIHGSYGNVMITSTNRNPRKAIPSWYVTGPLEALDF